MFANRQTTTVSNTAASVAAQKFSMFDSAALGIRCRDSSDDETSDESSADSDSDIDEHMAKTSIRLITTLSDDEQDDGVAAALDRIRIPESFSSDLTLVLDRQRKVSTASQRSPQCSAFETKSKEKIRPAPINFDILHNTTPKIEIEQVFDDVTAEELNEEGQTSPADSAHKRQSLDLENVNVSAASKRNAARTRMMQAIGRHRKAQLRRSESMDEVSSPSSPPTSSTLKPDSASPQTASSSSSASPLPCTPGTAFHHRSVSCPSPNVPQLHQFGEVSVMVTPPTPRPQGSPIIGVFIRGVHKPPPATRYCPCTFTLDPLLPQEYSNGLLASNGTACAQCREEASLKVPEFEMAPGRTKMMQQQRQQALALIAWQRSQQQMANAEWCRQVQQNAYQKQSSGSIKPLLLTKRSPPPPPTTSSSSPGSDSQSWRRDQDCTAASWTGSSASMYSQESGGSAADTAKSWRRKNQSPSSAPAFSSMSTMTTTLSGGKYIPPAKRSAGAQMQRCSLKGRKEGTATAQATVAPTRSNASSVTNSPERERAAQSMLARLQLVNASNYRLTM